jgi:putative PIN family toxin of toxin-antitoxin system
VLSVVLDTNVYVSALNFGGLPLELLLLGTHGEILICTSPSILSEVEGVLVRKFKWTDAQVAEALATLRTFIRTFRPRTKIDVIEADEPDNRILECALAARADRIVSGDRHLLALDEFRGIPIQSLRSFLESLRQ